MGVILVAQRGAGVSIKKKRGYESQTSEPILYCTNFNKKKHCTFCYKNAVVDI